jgi:hypothetical protein
MTAPLSRGGPITFIALEINDLTPKTWVAYGGARFAFFAEHAILATSLFSKDAT